MARDLTSPLAKGLIRLVLAPGRSLTESALRRAAGSGTTIRALHGGLDPMREADLLQVEARGAGRRWSVRPGQEREVLSRALGALSPRARLTGKDLLGVAAILQGSGGERPPAPRPEAVPPVPPTGDLGGRILATMRRLQRSSPYGSMVFLGDLAAELGYSLDALAGRLRSLEREGRIQLDPLSDPRVLPPARRGEGLRDRYRGLLAFASMRGGP